MNIYVLQNNTLDGMYVVLADNQEDLLFHLMLKSEIRVVWNTIFPEPLKNGVTGIILSKVFDELRLWWIYENKVPENHTTLKKGYLY